MKLLRFLLVSLSIFLSTPAFATCDTDGPATCAIIGASSSATVSPTAFTVTSTPSCQVVTNSGGVAIMVPMFSEAAWSSFLNNLQSGVSVSSCAVNCTGTPWGTIADGSSVTAYAANSVACGGSCSSEARTCNHGTLSGSYGYTSCSVGTCTASCTITYDGSAQTVASGTTITRWLVSSARGADPCTCGGRAEAQDGCNQNAQTATCTNGTVTGTNPITGTYTSCNPTCSNLCKGCSCP
jgi:hypothetical protein